MKLFVEGDSQFSVDVPASGRSFEDNVEEYGRSWLITR